MANYSAELDGVFQALSDPTRRAVLRQLAHGPASSSALAEPFGMTLPSFMKHLRILEASGLIRTSKRGRVRTCALDDRGFVAAEAWLALRRTAPYPAHALPGRRQETR